MVSRKDKIWRMHIFRPQHGDSKLSASPSFLKSLKSVVPPTLRRAKKKDSTPPAAISETRDCNLGEASCHMLYCTALALHREMADAAKNLAKGELLWSEVIYPLCLEEELDDCPPSTMTIYKYLLRIWEPQELSGESAVMCYAYVERFLSISNFPLRPTNWRRITLAAALISAKVWEDTAVWNSDFLEQFPGLEVSDLATMEREMLVALDFSVGLTASIYAKYFFNLRSLDKKNTERISLPATGTFSRVEIRSIAIEEDYRRQSTQRFKPRRRLSRSCTV